MMLHVMITLTVILIVGLFTLVTVLESYTRI